MGFLKRFTAGFKEEMPTIEGPEISLDSVDTWLNDYSASCFGGLEENAKKTYVEIGQVRKRLEGGLNVLEAATPNADTFPRIYRSANVNRENMVRQLRQMLSLTEVPKQTDIETAKAYYTSSIAAIIHSTEGSLKSHYHVKYLFEEESKEVISSVKALEALFLRLKTPMQAKEREIRDVAKSRSLVSGITARRRKMADAEAAMGEKMKKMEGLKTRLISRQGDLEKLILGKDYTDYKSLLEEEKALENRLRAKETRLNTLLIPISKALHRFHKMVGAGRYMLDAEEKRVLGYMAEAPQKLLGEGADISPVLNKLKELIIDNSVSLKGNQKEKALLHLGKLISKNPLPNLRAECKLLGEQRKALRERIETHAVSEREAEIKKDIEVYTGEISGLEEDTKRAQYSIDSLKTEIGDARVALEAALGRLSNKEVKVELGNLGPGNSELGNPELENPK